MNAAALSAEDKQLALAIGHAAAYGVSIETALRDLRDEFQRGPPEPYQGKRSF